MAVNLVGTAEAARFLGVCPLTLRRWVWAGLMPHIQVGPRKHWRFDLTAILKAAGRIPRKEA